MGQTLTDHRPVTPRPAATILALAPAEYGVEVVMVRRPPGGLFGGAWVFPGGIVEPADRVGSADGSEAMRCAAVRELREEVGVEMDGVGLQFVSRWITPPVYPRRYDTWFFVGSLGHSVALKPALSEIEEALWVSPAAALSAHQAQQWMVVLPTLAHLRWLARFKSIEEVLASCANARTAPIEPQVAADGSLVAVDLP
ncbi:MAG: NUDIX hydrolase [Actinomycetota bacterium]